MLTNAVEILTASGTDRDQIADRGPSHTNPIRDRKTILSSVPGGRLSGMTGSEPKADLRRYLQAGRDALVWKLDGLSDYDIRRPVTPTGTNLLGLIKHVASVELGYLGDTFGRPSGEPLPWFADGAEPNADMWATADESRDQIVGLYHRVWAHSDATIDALALDATGRVPWWPAERGEVTLHRILVHMIAETDRHAGHADIIRELIDGAVGLRVDNDNMAPGDQAWWETYRNRLEHVAREASRD
ncbi:MAG TPA: DinB family protein [Streptosporangiaceae bacterium]|nr:DinB family protein [Streptosporangiaceae bacterium]